MVAAGIMLAATAFMASAADFTAENYWENPQMVGENRETAHATYVPYSTVAKLKADAKFYATPWVEPASDLRISLNGQWKFNYVGDPANRPTDFMQEGFDASQWAEIPVPANWEMHGYGTPIYCNERSPFGDSEAAAGKIGRSYNGWAYDYNPVGSYLRTFEVPADWADKQLLLNFGGIYSAAFIWVNGQYIGYTQGANNDHEFDITSAARTGQNTLAVQVIRWSDGSYLEQQDMFRMSGIYRDVTLTAVPRTFVRDHYITAKLDPNAGYTSGQFNVELDIANRASAAASVTAQVELIGPDGASVWTSPAQAVSNLVSGAEQKVTLTTSLSNLQLWSAEVPTLYTVLVKLSDANGRELEAFATKYGFREIEQIGALIYINGQRIWFKGVNRSDTDPVLGRAVNEQTMLTDVLLMKQHNMNTIRTSHYPNAAKMYAMFDHFGLYTIDEADLECHPTTQLSSVPEWEKAFVDREERLVLRDRNHPAVVFWSLGNESGCGPNFKACYDRVRSLDPRLIHYEGQKAFRKTTKEYIYSDFTSTMYPSIQQAIWDDQDSRYQDTPHILVEYAHAMGNAVGNLQEYWDMMESCKRQIGGCIWDWIDQGIYRPSELLAGNPRGYTTGYDYPGPHQGNFVCNGLLAPDRKVTSKLIEVKKVYQYIKTKNFDPAAGTIEVTNAYAFLPLSEFELHWSLLSDGVEVESGVLADLQAAPGETVTLTIPYSAAKIGSGEEGLLNLSYRRKHAAPALDAGHEVALEQFTVQEPGALPEINLDELTATMTVSTDENITVRGADFSYQFAPSGRLISMYHANTEFIHQMQGPTFDPYRWIENDPDPGNEHLASQTKQVSITYNEGSAEATKSVTISTFYTAGSLGQYILRYTIYANGQMDMEAQFAGSSSVRRLGVSMALNPDLEQVEYYARGPWANYCDRKTGSLAGIYRTTVTDMKELYVNPQTMGGREDMRRLRLSDKDGHASLLIEAENLPSFTALHFTDYDLAEAAHDYDLTPRKETILHLDAIHRGIGNGSCGIDVGTLNQYKVPSSQIVTYKARFTPEAELMIGDEDPSLLDASNWLKTFSVSGNLGYKYEKNFLKPNRACNTIDGFFIVPPGTTPEVYLTLSGEANAVIFVDTEGDGSYSTRVTPRPNTGAYRIPVGKDGETLKGRIVISKEEITSADLKFPGLYYNFEYLCSNTHPLEGYTYPAGKVDGNQQTYLKQISSEGALENISWKASAYSPVVNVPVTGYVLANPGEEFPLTFKANFSGPYSTSQKYQDMRYTCGWAYVDWYGTGNWQFLGRYGLREGEEGFDAIGCNYQAVKEITLPLTAPADAAGRDCRVRMIYSDAWRDMTGPNYQNIFNGVAYDVRIRLTGDGSRYSDSEPRFCPNGSQHPQGKAYVASISTLGAQTDVDYSWSSQPDFYSVVPVTIEALPGQEFTLTVKGNRAGSLTSADQDLRWNVCHIFSDFGGEFTEDTRYGLYEWESGFKAAYGNSKLVLDIAHPVKIPADATPGVKTLRLIYQNAWRQLGGPIAQDVYEGQALDLSIRVLSSEDALPNIPTLKHSNTTYDLQGRRVTHPTRPGLYIRAGQIIRR